jgi:hypothetical protein
MRLLTPKMKGLKTMKRMTPLLPNAVGGSRSKTSSVVLRESR